MDIKILFYIITGVMILLSILTTRYLMSTTKQHKKTDEPYESIDADANENVISLFGSYPPAHQVQPENRELIYHRFVQDFMDVENARDLTAEQYMEQQMRLKRAGRMLLSQMKLE